MIRFIILFIVGYIVYRAIRSWMFPGESSTKTVSDRSAGKIDDVMIKDPQCQAYFPKRDAVYLSFGGKDLYFCSVQCRDEYLDAQSEMKDR
jgi:YHS domain-containing protein